MDQRYHRLTFTSGNNHIITKSYFSKINDISITRKIVFGRTLPKEISNMWNSGPYVGRQNFGKNTEIVRKTAKMKKLSKNREKLGSVKGSHSFIATQLVNNEKNIIY